MTLGPAALGLPRHGRQPPVSASPQRFSTQGYVEKGNGNGRRPHGRSGPRPGPVSRPPPAPQAVRAWQSLWPASHVRPCSHQECLRTLD